MAWLTCARVCFDIQDALSIACRLKIYCRHCRLAAQSAKPKCTVQESVDAEGDGKEFARLCVLRTGALKQSCRMCAD